MNRQGAVVGSSQTSIPLPPNNNGFVCVAGPDVYHGLAWGENGITNLPSRRDDDNCGNAAAINDSGEIAGQSENGAVDPITGVKEIRAVGHENRSIEHLSEQRRKTMPTEESARKRQECLMYIITLQFLLLGTISVALNTAVDLIVVLFAGALAQQLRNNPKFNRRQRTASGAGMIGLGVYVAASK